MKQPISGYTKLAGVIANPIKHSLSPMIHNTAYELIDYDAVYLAFDVEANDFEKAMLSVKTLDMLGVNISMPYKRQAYEVCDELSKEAELIGVVNTVVQKNKVLKGFNTDGIGFIRSLDEQTISINNKTITLLGAGGAARAIICQCALEGAKEINVFKRKNNTYHQIENELKEVSIKTGVIINLFDYSNQMDFDEVIVRTDILVNATQIGMGDDSSMPISDLSKINENHVVVDLIYHPLETIFLKEAKRKQATTINGLGMLLYQAAVAFKLMTGKEMPTKKIANLLEIEMEKKGEN